MESNKSEHWYSIGHAVRKDLFVMNHRNRKLKS